MAITTQKTLPSIFKYGILLEAAYQIFLIIPIFLDQTTQGTRIQSASMFFISILFTSAVFCLGEFFILRFDKKMISYLVLASECIRGFLFGFMFPSINRSMGGSTALNSVFSLVTAMSFGIGIGGIIAIAFSERINKIATTPTMKSVINILPALVILLLFMGTGFLESIGFGATRQTNPENLPPFTGQTIDYTAFNEPTWDSAYFLENILDQFTAGLKLPDEPVFNVTNTIGDSTEPPAYWRIRAYDTYKYQTATFTSMWEAATGDHIDLETSSAYSTPVPSGSLDAKFQVDILMNRSSATYEGYIPTTWNGKYGAYVDANTFSTEALGYPTTVYEVSPVGMSDSVGTKARVEFGSVGEGDMAVSYLCDYQQPDYVAIGASSLPRDQYLTVLQNTDPGNADNIWNTIQNLYLQIPTGNQLPSGVGSYAAWAEDVTQYASDYNNPSLSVMQQALVDVQEMAPESGELGLTFDEEMWIRNSFNQEMDHPDPGEDFNEWFLDRGSGVSIHFASLLCMFLRLQDIPARVVEGYAAGNETLGNNQKRVITNRWKHAWVEVLIPYLYTEGGVPQQGLQWIPMDPIGGALFGSSMPTDVGTPQNRYYLFNPNTLDVSNINTLQSTFGASVQRVGVLRADTGQEEDTLWANSPTIPLPEGTAYVSTALMTAAYDTQTGMPTSIPTPISGKTIRFTLLKGNESVGITNIPINNTVNTINATTNANGIAGFQFEYTIIPHGTGNFRFKAEFVNATDPSQIFIQGWSDSDVEAPNNIPPTSITDYDPIAFKVGTAPPPIVLKTQKDSIYTDSSSSDILQEDQIEMLKEIEFRQLEKTINGCKVPSSNYLEFQHQKQVVYVSSFRKEW